MDDNKILNLILEQLTEIKSEIKEMKTEIKEMKTDINSMKVDIQDIKTVQAQHTEQLQIIKEQTGRNAELESTVKELVDFKEYMKKFFQN